MRIARIIVLLFQAGFCFSLDYYPDTIRRLEKPDEWGECLSEKVKNTGSITILTPEKSKDAVLIIDDAFAGYPGPCYHNDKNLIEIEAESFIKQDSTRLRKWEIINNSSPDKIIAANASGNTYIQCLPDTRITHDDELVHGVNFSNLPAQIAILSYKIHIKEAGRYYVWVKAYSTGSEDNGVHVGIDKLWPESGRRMQWCDGKNFWTWANHQRVESNHCGEPHTIYLDIPVNGEHILQFSMREDGFRMDKIILTKNINYIPD